MLKRLRFLAKARLLATIDWFIFILPILLSLFGIAVLFSFQSKQPIAISQSVFVLVGLLMMITVAFFDYRNFKVASWYLYGLVIILLLTVMLAGPTIFGAKRWINLGFIQLQPSELAKISLVLVIGQYLAKEQLNRSILTLGLSVGILALIPILLIVRQPDLGTASVLIIICFGLLGYARLPRRFWVGVGILIMVALPVAFHSLHPYQRQRLYTFLNPGTDPTGNGYNVIQSVIAIGSGGIWGRGLGEGSQSQLQFLPVAHSDFIFAGVGEAFGFLGASILVILDMMLIWRVLNTAVIAQDVFGRYVALGIGIMWLYQSTINIGMNLGLAPITGIPLPFVSSGGTALVVNYFAAGILQSIYLRHKKIRF